MRLPAVSIPNAQSLKVYCISPHVVMHSTGDTAAVADRDWALSQCMHMLRTKPFILLYRFFLGASAPAASTSKQQLLCLVHHLCCTRAPVGITHKHELEQINKPFMMTQCCPLLTGQYTTTPRALATYNSAA